MACAAFRSGPSIVSSGGYSGGLVPFAECLDSLLSHLLTDEVGKHGVKASIARTGCAGRGAG